MKKLRNISIILAIMLCFSSAIMMFTACGGGQLATPKNIQFDLATGVVTFDAVEHADKYVVNIIYENKDGEKTVLDKGQFNAPETTYTAQSLTVDGWGKYYAEVQAVALDFQTYPYSEFGKSEPVENKRLSTPRYRIFRTRNSGPVKIQIDAAQYNTTYRNEQALPTSYELKIYAGSAATGTPALSHTFTNLSVEGTTAHNFELDASSVFTAAGAFVITIQAKAGAGAEDSILSTYNYNYSVNTNASRDQSTNVPSFSAGSYTFVND